MVVPPGLPATLATLRGALDGALAIVTGRPIETVDRLFGDAPGAVAGEHGGAIRHRAGEPIQRPDLPAPPPDWLEQAEALVAAFPVPCWNARPAASRCITARLRTRATSSTTRCRPW